MVPLLVVHSQDHMMPISYVQTCWQSQAILWKHRVDLLIIATANKGGPVKCEQKDIAVAAIHKVLTPIRTTPTLRMVMVTLRYMHRRIGWQQSVISRTPVCSLAVLSSTLHFTTFLCNIVHYTTLFCDSITLHCTAVKFFHLFLH